MSRTPGRYLGSGLELLEGPCCDDLTCPSRDAWPYPGETHEQFHARLREIVRRDAPANTRWIERPDREPAPCP